MPSPDADPKIVQRFSGRRGEKLVMECLKDQRIVLGNEEAAEELFARGQVVSYVEGDFLSAEDSWENDIFFILAGSVQVTIKGFRVAQRSAGQHVGEMALVDPSQPRSASVIALEPTVCLLISEEDFSAVAAHHPDMWRQIAKEVADRLRQRKKFIRPSNPVPFLFIACASESLPVAMEFRDRLEKMDEVVVEIWTDNVFKPSQGTMESLEGKLETSDFTLAVFSADDKVKSRGQQKFAPRDNTVFELGLFAGAIGRHRSFFAVEKGIELKIPSDLAGITSVRFSRSKDPEHVIDVEEACAQLVERFKALGPR